MEIGEVAVGGDEEEIKYPLALAVILSHDSDALPRQLKR
jgi:hypothetical protein